MIDLYTLFVEQVFGGFWITTFVLAFIFCLILWFGEVTPYSTWVFIALFFFAMGTGQGYPLISVMIVLSVLIWAVLQVRRPAEES